MANGEEVGGTLLEAVSGDGALREAFALGAAMQLHEIDGVHVAILPSGDGEWRAEVVDVDAARARPRRTDTLVTVPEEASFVAYLNRFKRPGTLIFAQMGRRSMRGEIDYHEPSADAGLLGWRDHVVVLDRPSLPPFAAWMSTAHRWLPQGDFAEFLELRMGEIVEPDGATLFELAEHFTAQRSLSFGSQKRLSDGNVQLHWVEETEGRGPSGDVVVPTRFTVRLQPYEDSGSVDVEARLRWRLHEQKVSFMFVLGEELEEWLRAEFRERMEEIAEATDVPVIATG